MQYYFLQNQPRGEKKKNLNSLKNCRKTLLSYDHKKKLIVGDFYQRIEKKKIGKGS